MPAVGLSFTCPIRRAVGFQTSKSGGTCDMRSAPHMETTLWISRMRLPGDLDLAKVVGLYVLVWSYTEAKELAGMKTSIQQLIRGFLPMEHITTML
jgi:hypothetical protein